MTKNNPAELLNQALNNGYDGISIALDSITGQHCQNCPTRAHDSPGEAYHGETYTRPGIMERGKKTLEEHQKLVKLAEELEPPLPVNTDLYDYPNKPVEKKRIPTYEENLKEANNLQRLHLEDEAKARAEGSKILVEFKHTEQLKEELWQHDQKLKAMDEWTRRLGR